jgi:tRNA A37 methylthiotransferase MiaB
MKKIFLYSNTCCLRLLDANKIRSYLSKNNYKIVTKPQDANIIIFFTCAFTDEITEDSWSKIKEFKKYDAELIVAGCLPDIEKNDLTNIFNGKTINTKDLDKIERLFPESKAKFRKIADANFSFRNINTNKPIVAFKRFFRNIQWIKSIYVKIKDHVLKNLFGEYALNTISFLSLSEKPYMIRVAWGCRSNCSYCAIKKAIGPLKSKPLDQIIKEFKIGLNKGYKKISINADNPGEYGLDIGCDFPKMLDELTKIQGDYRISLLNIKPQWFIKYIDELVDILKRQKIADIEIPIQSGSSRILKLMHRFSDIKKIKAALTLVRKTFPDIPIYTHVIIGFPTETEEDLQQTIQFIKEINFNGCLIFRFSCKAGTLAEKLEQKIPEKEISRRMKYAKKFLKKEGYKVISIPRLQYFLFEKRN